MRVAILTLHDPVSVRGGVETYIRHLQRTFEQTEVFAGYEILGEAKTFPFMRGPQAAAAAARAFLRRHRDTPFDLLISNGMSGWTLGGHSNIPRINVYHGTNAGFSGVIPRGRYPHFWAYARFINSHFEWLSGLRASARVAVSYSVQEEICQFYRLDSEVILNGVDLSRFQPSSKTEARMCVGLPAEAKVALFVGRFNSVGGYTKGASILNGLAERRPRLLFVCVVGEARSSTRPRLRNVQFRFNVPPDKMPTFYSASDLLVFPTYYEGCAYVPLEAMACDVPAVLSMTGMFKHIVPHRAGVVVNAQSVDSYLRAIDVVLGGAHYNARQFVTQHFSLERFMQAYRQLASTCV